jgi:hypothetical protein
MGAAWAMSLKIYPILVPPLTYDDVKAVLSNTQVQKIDEEVKYSEIRDYLTAQLTLDHKSSTKWDTKRKDFLKELPEKLKYLIKPE